MAKTIKPVAYKATLKTVSAYEKKYKAGKVIRSTTMEKYKRSISRYVTKSGELKPGLTNKQIENFNKKVEAFKNNRFADLKQVEKSTKKTINTFVEQHAGATKATGTNVMRMVVEANAKKIKIDSDKIVELAMEQEENKAVTNEEFIKIFKEYLKRINKGVPFEAKKYVNTDDTVKIMQELIYIHSHLNNNKDKRKFFSMIKGDKTVEEILDYFTENPSVEEETKNGTKTSGKKKRAQAQEVSKEPKTSRKGWARIEKQKGKKKPVRW